MKCPGCSAEVPDGSSICPSCDYIIDDSFLPAAPAPVVHDEGERTPTGVPRPTPPPTRAGKKKRPARRPRAANGAATPSGPAPPPPPAPPPLAATLPTRFAPEVSGERASYSPVFRPEETMEDAKLFLGSLGTADKLTLVGVALIALCSFFPWKETAAEGEVIGLQSLGIVATGLMLLALVALVARARRSPRFSPAMAWLVQLACSGVTVVWCLVFIKLSWDPTEAPSIDGNLLVPVSKPALGAYLGVVSGILAAAGTLLGLKDSSP